MSRRVHSAPLAVGVLLGGVLAGPTYVLAAGPAVAQPAPATGSALTAAGDLGLEAALARARRAASESARLVELTEAALLHSPPLDVPARSAEARASRQRWTAEQLQADDLATLVRWNRTRPRTGPGADALRSSRALTSPGGAQDLTRGAPWTWAVPGGRAHPRAVRAVHFALAQLGDPYVYAGNGPDVWDCSGLTVGAYRSVGVGLPRVSRQQFWAGSFVPRDQLLPGDLVFFAHDPAAPSTIHHVAMFAGDGLMVHAPRTGDVVRLARIPERGYAGAVRMLAALPEQVAPSPTSSPLPSAPTVTPRPTSPRPTAAPPRSPHPTPPHPTPPHPAPSPSAPAPTQPPATTAPPTSTPPTSTPPTSTPPTSTPPTTEPPTTAPATGSSPTDVSGSSPPALVMATP